jgi:hypothetical protein
MFGKRERAVSDRQMLTAPLSRYARQLSAQSQLEKIHGTLRRFGIGRLDSRSYPRSYRISHRQLGFVHWYCSSEFQVRFAASRHAAAKPATAARKSATSAVGKMPAQTRGKPWSGLSAGLACLCKTDAMRRASSHATPGARIATCSQLSTISRQSRKRRIFLD